MIHWSVKSIYLKLAIIVGLSAIISYVTLASIASTNSINVIDELTSDIFKRCQDAKLPRYYWPLFLVN